MNTLQQIIKEMKDDILIAEREFKRKSRHGFSSARTYEGAALAINKYIPKLESLLNEQPEAITEDSHLRKHVVGRSAASEETTNKEFSGESSSETQAVGQNEQTKEVCHCDFERMVGWNEDVGNYCLSCGKPMDASATSFVS